MIKRDISMSRLDISNLTNVIKSEITKKTKITHTKGRHSDAFIYILSGSCAYVFDDGTEFCAGKGDILYLASGSVYNMYIDNEYSFIFCDFDFICQEKRKSDVFSPVDKAGTEILFFKLLGLHKKGSPTAFSECMSILYKIYGIIVFTAAAEYVSPSARNIIKSAQSRIESAPENNQLTVASLACDAGISEVYFRKLFKKHCGISPSDYITAVRLKKAKSLMRYPFLSLSDCAKQSGFSSLQYFCRVFKKETGITPAAYRKSIL